MRDIKFRVWVDGEMNYDNFDTPMIEFNQGVWEMQHNYGYVFMQFTGLKDKNGVDIYEGDIVRVDNSIGVVEYDDCMFGILFEKLNNLFQSLFDTRVDYENRYEIIGNIHENPELLK